MRKTKLGASFSDSIYSQKSSFVRLKRGYGGDEPRLRQGLFLLLIFLVGGVLLFRLFFLQVITGQQYRLLSDSNRTHTEVIHAPRGIIFDRNGIPLVFNMPGYREIIGGKTIFLDQKSALPLLAKGDKHIEIDSLRQYPFGEATAHIVGYIGQISQEELTSPAFEAYRVGDVIGKMGVEQSYEKQLKGIDGRKLEEVDATGKFVRTLGITDPIPGRDVTLTVDNAIQQAAFAAMSTVQKGAVVVSKPNGEIIAMVSKPSFDPNLFTLGQQYKESSSSAYPSVSSVLLDNSGQPLLNRAIGGVYPPGSTFKLVTAAAGLETKKITDAYTIEDTGILKIGTFSFSNWYYSQYGKTDGTVDVIKAIQRSNDIFFYKLGELLGVDTISAQAAKFGVGATLGIDLAGEHAGLLPTKEWKQKNIGEDWYTGDDYHYGIGQGYLLTTPLQVNAWTQAIANGGILFKPHVLLSSKPQVIQRDVISTQTQQLLRQGMIEACDTGGVAWPLFQFKVKNEKLKIDGKDILPDPSATSSALPSEYKHVVIACKTGTAQHGDDQTLPHAWITLFAPAYHPEIVVTVLAESSGEGSNIAAPVAKKILEAYFSK
jgi:penicillin-binding protein 2